MNELDLVWSMIGFADLHLTWGELAEVSVVISTHFHVEDFSFGDLGVGNEYVFEQIKHILANTIQFSLDHLAVLID